MNDHMKRFDVIKQGEEALRYVNEMTARRGTEIEQRLAVYVMLLKSHADDVGKMLGSAIGVPAVPVFSIEYINDVPMTHDGSSTILEMLRSLVPSPPPITVQGVVPDHVVRDENALRDIINNNLMVGLLPFDNTDAGSALYLAANRLRALVGNSGYALLDVDGKTIVAEYRLEDVAWRAAVGEERIWLARVKVQVNDRFVVDGVTYLAGAPGWCVIDPNEPVGSPSIG